jgi:branched-chain amino acid transport system permease protein
MTEAVIKNDWRAIARIGLLAGVGMLYVAVIGLVTSFSGRAIVNGIITVGRLLLFIPSFYAGAYVVRHRLTGENMGGRLATTAVAGLLSAVPVTAVFLLEALFNQGGITLRDMFVNVSPALREVLFYGQSSLLMGMLLVLAIAAVLGMSAALFYALTDRWQQVVTRALLYTLAVGLFSELFVQILRPILPTAVLRVLIRNSSLTPLAAIVLVLLIGLAVWYWPSLQATRTDWLKSKSDVQRVQVQYGSIAFGVILLLALPWVLNTFLADVANTVGLYIMMGLGLNIAVGMAGLLDLGYLTNYAVGAYIMAILTSTASSGSGMGWPFWVVLPICIVGAMLTGFLFALPVLRMRGDYLAIATLGFGEIIRVLAISDWLRPFIGGAQGVQAIPKPNFFGLVNFNDPRWLYYIILAGCALVLYVVWRLNNSRMGRQWMAIREDEDVAEAMGINLVKTKVLAFTLSAAAGGLAGGIFAAKLGTVFPQSFNVFVSINVLAVIIVGGMGSIPGVIVGAIVLIGLPEILREFNEYRQLIYGALLVWMMLRRPEGLIPSAIRQRELRANEEFADEQPV